MDLACVKRRLTSYFIADYLPPQSHREGAMHLHYGDLTDSTCLVKIITLVKPDEIYNLGAQSHVKVRPAKMFSLLALCSNLTGLIFKNKD